MAFAWPCFIIKDDVVSHLLTNFAEPINLDNRFIVSLLTSKQSNKKQIAPNFLMMNNLFFFMFLVFLEAVSPVETVFKELTFSLMILKSFVTDCFHSLACHF